MITSAQIRAARALLGREQRDLAEAAKVSFSSIRRLETAPEPQAHVRTVDAVRRAFEERGLTFNDGGHPSVSLRRGRS